jgi:DNA invertase Pin-like site-specific DNA recombinase
MASEPKPLRCAIYTRKSTEHGLELEFNSLDAQRDACEAYIKSQASQGWRALPQHYNDPAYSGGNLDRPALKKLLTDIETGKIDVVVVYKIDRLTRSLADFAKLVEAFDARSISFVAVTQQFNTTTSMGRLTLNVLLSFAQFERELSSERVRDKVAASRRKGKWTGGSIPLGYDVKDKKLVPNKTERETVNYIFKRYLELRSFQKLVEALDSKGIVSKSRPTAKQPNGGAVRLTYGPLAYLLKNRVYIGETGHGGKWFEGEHEAIVNRETFDQVQALLGSNAVDRNAHRSDSEAIFKGLLFDDRGNRMSPSFSTKNGVRYRFYVSATLLRGRKAECGSLGRVSATEIESTVIGALRQKVGADAEITSDAALVASIVNRIAIGQSKILIETRDSAGNDGQAFEIAWCAQVKRPISAIDPENRDERQPDPKLVQAVVRAHVWVESLRGGTYQSVEDLARSAKLHPKMVRQELRLAFLAPEIMEAILNGNQPAALSLPRIPKTLPLSWPEQRQALEMS